MPFVNVRTVKGLLNDQQKQMLMNRIADVLVEIEGGGNPDFRNLVWVLIDESEPSQWQIGHLNPDSIAALVRQRDAQ